MKLSTRKRIIQVIGIIFCLWIVYNYTIMLLVPFYASGWHLYIPNHDFLLVRLGVLLFLGQMIAFSILTWQNKGRLILVVSGIVFSLDFLAQFVKDCIDYCTIEIPQGIILGWYYEPPPWWHIGISVVGILLSIYFVIIVIHKDTKLLFERKDKSEDITPNL